MSGENETNTGPGKPFILERPLWRGVFNGIVLCLLMLGAQYQGWLGPNTDVTGEALYRAVFYGVVFGLVMYLYTLWRVKRQEPDGRQCSRESRACKSVASPAEDTGIQQWPQADEK